MTDVDRQALMSALRSILIAVGAALTAHGYLNEATANELVGAVLTIAPIIWGIADKYASERHTVAREVAAAAAASPTPPSTTTGAQS